MKTKVLQTCMLASVFMLASLNLSAQNYLISFTGSGQSSEVETVEVKNLDQGTTLTISGADTLQLVGALGINPIAASNDQMLVYPNPTNEMSRLEFFSTQGQVQIEVYDFAGKLLAARSEFLQQGVHQFNIRGISAGAYLVKVKTPEQLFSHRLVSTSQKKSSVVISFEGSNFAQPAQPALKGTTNIIVMQYNEGERIMLTASSGFYTHIKTLVPDQTQVIDFEFIDCFDGDGNLYTIVSIGDQIWMAENLRTTSFTTGIVIPGPFAGADWVLQSTTNQSPAYTIYDHNHSSAAGLESPQEVVDAYGVMYNWHAIAAGNLCPSGWRVPDTLEWDQMLDYIINSNSNFDEDNIAMAVKSCRQINSPLGGDCATDIHPRWRENEDHYGVDAYGMGLVAAGYILSTSGNSSWMGARGYWWTSSESPANPDAAVFRRFNFDDSVVSKGTFNKGVGQPIRCIKE